MRRAVVSILAIVSIISLPLICAAQTGKAAGVAGDDGGGEITGTTGMAAEAIFLASADAGNLDGVGAATDTAARSLQDAGDERESYRFEFMWPDKPWYFNGPLDIAIDNNGCVYVVDEDNHCVQKFTSNGELITTWGSHGSGDGEFYDPCGIAVDGSGNVYVADSGNGRIQKFTSSGEFIAQWGSHGSGDGEFIYPQGIAVDGSGNVYVADSGNGRIQKFTSSGEFIAQWGSHGSGDGEFIYPQGIAVDGSGNVYVADSGNGRIQKFTSSGEFIAQWGSHGSGDGEFIYPQGIAVDGSGNVYVADTGNGRIQKFTSSGEFIAQWGSHGSGDGEFYDPCGIAVDGSGNVYVADSGNGRIQKFTSSGEFIAQWGSHGSGDGEFIYPQGIAVDGSGNVYVADSGNGRIQKFTSSGEFIAQWGSHGSGDGEFYDPCGIAVDGSGNVYVADSGNGRIQKFTSSGEFIAQWGSHGSGDGEFSYPYAIAVDGSGNVYVADLVHGRIQKFTSSGEFIAQWGSQGSGDGEFSYPQGIAVDGSGNIYVADTGNGRIQKFTSSGEFIAQWGSHGSGDGEFSYPQGIAVDGSGNIYVADTFNDRIQKFTADGEFITKFDGYDNNKCLLAPYDVSIDPEGKVYVADSHHHCIQVYVRDNPVVNISYLCDKAILTWTGYSRSTFHIFKETSHFTTIEGLSPAAVLDRNSRSYEMGSLEFGTSYYVAVAAVEVGNITTTIEAQEVLITGSLCFNSKYYNLTQNDETAVITLTDMALNTDSNSAQTVDINVISDSDAVGITMSLTETGIDTGIFTSTAFGKDLGFTFQDSDDENELIRVAADGGTVTALFTDQVSEVSRMDQAIADASPPVTTLVPDGDFSCDGDNNYAPISFTYTLSSVDNHSGVERIEYSIDGSPLAEFTVAFLLNTEGPHTLIFKAMNRAGIWEDPNTVVIIVDDTPPAAPVNLTGSQVDLQVDISWTVSSETDLRGYNVYRDGAKINTELILATSYSNPVNSGKTYQYNITAVDHVGNEGLFSDTFSITTISVAPVITSPAEGTAFIDSEITVRGTAEMGATVEIFVNGVSQGTTVATSTGYFSLSGVQISAGINSITAVATSTYGPVSPSSEVVTIPLDPRPQPPGGLTADPGDTVINISWNANQETDLAGYFIYRDNEILSYDILTTTSYTDTMLINGKEYSYTVTAADSNGSESLPTSTIDVSPVAGPGWEIP